MKFYFAIASVGFCMLGLFASTDKSAIINFIFAWGFLLQLAIHQSTERILKAIKDK